MLKSQLGNELRERQRKVKLVKRKIIDRMSDDEIIISYITCSCCGEPQVPLSDLGALITAATSADSFFDLCNRRQEQLHAEEDESNPSKN